MTQIKHGLTRYDMLVEDCLKGDALMSPDSLPQTFGRLLPENRLQWHGPPQELVDIFEDLVNLIDTNERPGPAEAGMTFFGQFVDHDITLDATSAIGTRIDPRFIRNIRTPNLDLDCVYGDGPEASPHIYSELAAAKGFLLFGRNDNPAGTLARNDRGTALIGDPRNDENILVSQVQGAFICLHNILMTNKKSGGSDAADIRECAHMGLSPETWSDAVIPELEDFEEVRRFVRLHYQWLIINRLLPAFCTEEAIAMAQNPHLFPGDSAIMPVEFSGACYRFGHATVQPKYQLTQDGPELGLFALEGFKRRPIEGNLDMNMLFDMDGTVAPRARPVGLSVASPLFALPFVTDPIRFDKVLVEVPQSGNLPLRNILRDRFALHIASGQQVASHVGAEVRDVPDKLAAHHIEKTPLWFYALEEAEHDGGGRLTGAGGAVVAWVLRRLLLLDKTSVLHAHGFQPWSGFGGTAMTMGSLMKFVEDHRDSIAHAKQLRSG